ncbi:MAG TPA: DUF3817 domain-containing protein [Candidatus Saccharimonadales bacterium]|nr:DUF3817 domain-containing protein [Candidatus Saccharimonadales bacterium]
MKRYRNFKPFSENEAWGLFRLAALAEAVGWTLLIGGLLIQRYLMHGDNTAVLLAGRVHGTLFLIYATAAVVLAPSQSWSLRRTLVAGVASAPPYGSLMFEQWAAHKRRRESLEKSLFLASYRQLVSL